MATFTGDDTGNSFNAAPSYLYERNTFYLNGGNDAGYGGDAYDYMSGGSGDDLLNGSFGDDFLDGGADNDSIYGGGGADTISGGSGINYLSGGTGDDIISGSQGDTIYADTGDDVIYLYRQAGFDLATVSGGSGDDVFYSSGAGLGKYDGGTGEDTIDYTYSSQQYADGVIVNLLSGKGGGVALGDTYKLIEDAVGSYYADTLIGNGSVNALYGYNGDDVIAGGGGGDYLDGEDGIDTLDYRTSFGAVNVNMTTGTAFGGDAQEDQFFNFENINGGAYNDLLTGDAGANVMRGYAGNDKVSGAAGSDRLFGLDGRDQLTGGAGSDVLYGGTGADQFLYASVTDSTVAAAGRDRIFDFSHAEGDRIDLSAIDANTAAAKNQAFVFKGTAAFGGTNGELHVVANGALAFIQGDINGDKVADFSIQVNYDAAKPFVAADFVL